MITSNYKFAVHENFNFFQSIILINQVRVYNYNISLTVPITLASLFLNVTIGPTKGKEPRNTFNYDRSYYFKSFKSSLKSHSLWFIFYVYHYIMYSESQKTWDIYVTPSCNKPIHYLTMNEYYWFYTVQ